MKQERATRSQIWALTLGAIGLCAAIFASSVGGRLHAQGPAQRVLELNRQAMEDYTNLEIERAQKKLNEALAFAQAQRVAGPALARTQLNLGVVAIGGLGDNGAGLEHFVRALQADPTIQLDPLTSTPDIQTVFNLAKQRASRGGGRASGAPSGAGTIPHVAVPEQRAQTPVPVFIEAPDDAPVGTVYLYYRGRGMSEYRRVPMSRMTGGFGLEIPCADVFEPSVDYYIVAFARDGSPMGFAGTQDQPIRVPIVRDLSGPAPALPGRPAPVTCSEAECPPGMAGCGGAGLGETCNADSECGSGRCEDNFCVAAEDEASSTDIGLFFEVGAGAGTAMIQRGMPAAEAPGGDACFDDAGQFISPTDPAFNEAECGSFIPSQVGSAECDLGEGEDYCVRTDQSGLAPVMFSLRGTLGYYITDRLAVAGTARFQFDTGPGDLANILLGLRVQYKFTTPHTLGFSADAFVGTSVGQIQPKLDQQGDFAPHIRSGLNGVQVGSVLGYRLNPYLSITATPEIHVLFPTSLVAADVTLGLALNF